MANINEDHHQQQQHPMSLGFQPQNANNNMLMLMMMKNPDAPLQGRQQSLPSITCGSEDGRGEMAKGTEIEDNNCMMHNHVHSIPVPVSDTPLNHLSHEGSPSPSSPCNPSSPPTDTAGISSSASPTSVGSSSSSSSSSSPPGSILPPNYLPEKIAHHPWVVAITKSDPTTLPQYHNHLPSLSNNSPQQQPNTTHSQYHHNTPSIGMVVPNSNMIPFHFPSSSMNQGQPSPFIPTSTSSSMPPTQVSSLPSSSSPPQSVTELNVTGGNGPAPPHKESNFLDISDYLNMPQTAAAKQIGIPTSTLSKRWREAARQRKWPWRTVCKIDKEIMTLLHNVPASSLNDETPIPEDVKEGIALLLRKRQQELQPVVIRIN